MEEHSKQDREPPEGTQLNEIVFQSRWNSLNSYKNRLKTVKFIANDRDVTVLRNMLLDLFVEQVQALAKEWKEEYENMNALTDYERIQQKVCIELIDNRILK